MEDDLDDVMTHDQQRKLAVELGKIIRVGHGEARIVIINGHVRLLRTMVSQELERQEPRPK